MNLQDYEFRDEEIEIGIDEAGRGPVLGPMVYGCTFWPVKVGDDMRKRFGFADSKQLSEEQRDKMFEDIKELEHCELGFAVDVLMPEDLSALMLAELHLGGQNLNVLSYNSAFGLIKKVLVAGFKVTRIICD